MCDRTVFENCKIFHRFFQRVRETPRDPYPNFSGRLHPTSDRWRQTPVSNLLYKLTQYPWGRVDASNSPGIRQQLEYFHVLQCTRYENRIAHTFTMSGFLTICPPWTPHTLCNDYPEYIGQPEVEAKALTLKRDNGKAPSDPDRTQSKRVSWLVGTT